MTHLAALLLLMLGAQEDLDALGRGQKYLEKIGEAWSLKLPDEIITGLFMGRAWIGHVRVTVKAAPDGSGAAFEMQLKGEMSIGTQKFNGDARIRFSKTMSLVSVESSSVEPDMKRTKTLTVIDGKFKLDVDENGKVKTSEGVVAPGTTWDGKTLPLFLIPDEDAVALQSLDSEKGVVLFHKLVERKKRSIGGKESEFRVLTIKQQGKEADSAYYGDDGRIVEVGMQNGAVRMRPVTEAEVGKDLDEKREVKPAERALLDMWLAIKRNEKERVLASFDIPRLCDALVPGYKDLDADKRKEADTMMTKQLEQDLLSETMRDGLPDEKVLEEGLAAGMKLTMKDDVAHVLVMGKKIWKLAEAKDGDRKGKWLIIGIEDR